jgi:hypothetical protein
VSYAAALMLSALAAAPALPNATATLPLSELLPLFKEQPEAPPPVGALVSQAKLEGRTNGAALEVTATLVVDVMAGGWQRVSLFRLTPGVVPVGLPELAGGTLGVHQKELWFFSRIPGRHAVTVQLSVRAVTVGERHTARLVPGADLPPVQLELVGDEVDAGPLQVHPSEGGFELRWNARPEPAQAKVVARPPLEPAVTSAVARFVTTLEGKGQLTVDYGLKLDRPQRFGVELPRGYVLTRVRVNDELVPVPEGQRLSLEVAPAKAGETAARVELSLAKELGVFHLSGALKLELPAVGWPIAELRAVTFLPAVFTWKRAGGSLEPVEGDAWSKETGLPGSQQAFRQFLVSGTAPTLELEYAVDLERRYFRARAPAAQE